MERLRSSDPARIAGHRLLGRLGAGGMGVVYLARTTAGSLVALKVLAAEYAEDAGFRERFRREVEVARRVDSPWAVPLVDADPDAEAPWLATAYVPGPSLAEAVTSYGPLDEHGLRVLGGRLAMALGEVHKAGLVHRDLKPGNVLLAPDGPRLIDFGIARAPEDHSLTATGFVVGTPGYLAPEQADERGGHAVGGPSDVFSLGCVLAFAATGRPPFGTGALDALLYRAVHDAADLDGVPAALAGLLSRCLAKDPALRPEVSQIVGELQPDEPSDDAPASWLPEEVVALIARRSTEALALPEIEHTEIAGGASPAGTSAAATAPADGARVRTGSRSTASVDDTAAPASGTDDTRPTAAADAPGTPARRRALLLGAGALLAGGGATAWWAAGRNDAPDGGKPAAARRPAYTVAFHGDLSGDQRATGAAQEHGLRLAVEQFNARRDAPFQVGVRAEDDGGDPAEAARLAKRLADDPTVLAVVGPTTDATATSALAAYDAALVPVLAVSPGAIALSVQGFRSFLHARLPDSLLPFFIDPFLRSTHPRRVGVVMDRAADNYGWEIIGNLTKQLTAAGQPFVPRVVGTLRTDFENTVDDLLAADADSFAFAGLPDRAASFARTLRERGYSGARATGPALLDPRFLTVAGEAADGWTIVAPVVDPAGVPEAKAFVSAYRKRFAEAPPRYAAEAYDVTSLVLKSLADLPSKDRTRENLLVALRAAKYKGVTRTYAFQKNGLPVIDGTGGYLWRVEDGAFVYGGPASLAA
ncbi:bifunctional serine/threonine-protein kinase/ABC transporter substrate-binding protein [Streptomyces scabiei]|uniref:bifunctional serine/threonine-protein kinase/ABC transporter substrate-binding protein n=1 Tax=Streptomyces scabiei TaxID=1930 RepID=UPI001B30FEA0|nr:MULTISPECIES: bifunctional serine/threonine-protein kinase/ABC transporter substrate-binding protein [Streptomyces]MBP5880183.1 ABC transporter substrate-binding protein [Streptomyces sp. LBUM 1477]MBP5904032.1 ABC transporter substrate-binding protein [Streptomyces sp. LBUM 1488]MDW8477691.1 bifunctional serine/threonine-protein kinase/ABC transporter substrate-binding protein [Streptomyces scabiei]MDX2567623.1 bifunctional serine/threonine-protein kinase/ABC transporter substrate-binding p